jgi:hypothetical protein
MPDIYGRMYKALEGLLCRQEGKLKLKLATASV